MIYKNPVDAENGLRPARFYPSARSALMACLRGVKAKSVLLPSYIGYTDREGSGVLDPITELGLKFTFYPLGRDLLVDPSVISQSLDQNPDIDVALLIHYFGWPGGDVSAIRAVCDDANVLLIEDCAHAFHWGQDNPTLGVTGSFSIYSIHKYLASETGGILYSTSSTLLGSAISTFESIDSRVLDLLLRADLKRIAQLRQKNLSRVLDGITSFEGIEPLRHDIPLTPQSLPVLIKGDGMREKLYFRLLERGVPTTALYYRLHHALDRNQFPDAFDVSNRILNLPIHQDMNEECIDRMLDELGKALKELHR